MKNFTPNIFFIFISLFFVSVTTHAAGLPIFEDFSGAKPAEWELRGSGAWDVFAGGDHTLLLTPNAGDASGLGFYDSAFPSSQGIVSEFTYYANEGDGADGLVFFLVDGDQVDAGNIAPGALGGALGYSQSIGVHDGIPHAYLGVGFDEFGNFLDGGGGPGRIPNNVALRGSGDGQIGYAYLTHRDVASAFGYETDTGWRTARVTVLPDGTGATVRVEMSFDGGDTWKVVINDFHYNEIPPANLKLGFSGGTGGSTNIHAIGDLSVTVPADLQLNVITSPNGVYKRGDLVSYTYSVTNAGPNDAGIVAITNNIPQGDSGFTNIAWSYSTNNGQAGSGDGTNIASIPVSMSTGVVTTVTITARVSLNLINTDNLDVFMDATPGTGINDPSPSSAHVALDIDFTAPTSNQDSALDGIEAYAQSGGANMPPTIGVYEDAGITGVTADNIAAINAAVAGTGRGAASTQARLQEIVNMVLARGTHSRNGPIGGSSVPDYKSCRDVVAKNYSEFGMHAPELCQYNPAPATAVKATSTIPVRDLKLKLTGIDVGMLQTILSVGNSAAAKALAKVGMSNYFGQLTKSALVEYQKKNGLPPTGYFGPMTRKYMTDHKVSGLWW